MHALGFPVDLSVSVPLEAAPALLFSVPPLCLGPRTERSLLPNHGLISWVCFFPTLCRALVKTAFVPGVAEQGLCRHCLCHRNTKQPQSGLTQEAWALSVIRENFAKAAVEDRVRGHLRTECPLAPFGEWGRAWALSQRTAPCLP